MTCARDNWGVVTRFCDTFQMSLAPYTTVVDDCFDDNNPSRTAASRTVRRGGSASTLCSHKVALSRMPTVASVREFSLFILAATASVFYRLDVVENTDSNPNQTCEPDPVEDRLSAEEYLEMEDGELWEMLVNGKGIGLCNIRVAGPGEDTDLYAYSGVVNDEGDHGYPGKHAG